MPKRKQPAARDAPAAQEAAAAEPAAKLRRSPRQPQAAQPARPAARTARHASAAAAAAAGRAESDTDASGSSSSSSEESDASEPAPRRSAAAPRKQDSGSEGDWQVESEGSDEEEERGEEEADEDEGGEDEEEEAPARRGRVSAGRRRCILRRTTASRRRSCAHRGRTPHPAPPTAPLCAALAGRGQGDQRALHSHGAHGAAGGAIPQAGAPGAAPLPGRRRPRLRPSAGGAARPQGETRVGWRAAAPLAASCRRPAVSFPCRGPRRFAPACLTPGWRPPTHPPSQAAAEAGLNYGLREYPGDRQLFGPDLHAFLLQLTCVPAGRAAPASTQRQRCSALPARAWLPPAAQACGAGVAAPSLQLGAGTCSLFACPALLPLPCAGVQAAGGRARGRPRAAAAQEAEGAGSFRGAQADAAGSAGQGPGAWEPCVVPCAGTWASSAGAVGAGACSACLPACLPGMSGHRFRPAAATQLRPAAALRPSLLTGGAAPEARGAAQQDAGAGGGGGAAAARPALGAPTAQLRRVPRVPPGAGSCVRVLAWGCACSTERLAASSSI